MKIGFAVEGATDRAFLLGLQKRWCPDAEMIEGQFRGTTGKRLRAELKQNCNTFFQKGCDIFIFLTDANVNDWRERQRSEIAKLPVEFRGVAVYGMADRNIECWLCSDAQYVASKTGRDAADFAMDDPKGRFVAAMQITRDEKREQEIVDFVVSAPLAQWLSRSKSFEDFFDQLWTVSKQKGCQIENLREK